MGKFYNGYENISVELINFAGNDLARQVTRFGGLGEFYEDPGNKPYDPQDPQANKIVDEILNGKTFPKYALEGHTVAFQINNISRVCLAQLTREKGFFCSSDKYIIPFLKAIFYIYIITLKFFNYKIENMNLLLNK